LLFLSAVFSFACLKKFDCRNCPRKKCRFNFQICFEKNTAQPESSFQLIVQIIQTNFRKFSFFNLKKFNIYYVSTVYVDSWNSVVKCCSKTWATSRYLKLNFLNLFNWFTKSKSCLKSDCNNNWVYHQNYARRKHLNVSKQF
jgi:hypothetical protein